MKGWPGIFEFSKMKLGKTAQCWERRPLILICSRGRWMASVSQDMAYCTGMGATLTLHILSFENVCDGLF